MKKLLLMYLIFLFGSQFTNAQLLLTESFETDGEGTRYTSNPFQVSCDFFLRDNNTSSCLTNNPTGLDGTFYWAGEDTDSGGDLTGIVTLNALAVTGLALDVDVLLGLGRPNDGRFEIDDELLFQYNMDGGGWITFAAFYGSNDGLPESTGNLVRDTDLDGFYNPGAPEINTFVMQNWNFTIPATGNSVQIRFIMGQDQGGGEEIMIDNIRINGTVPCINPTIPSALSASPSSICTGLTSTLSWTGALNDATQWHIYTGSCGGTEIGTSATNSFTTTALTGNTTFYIRGEDGAGCVDESTGDCNSIAVTILVDTDGDGICDVTDTDDDNDGVADSSDPNSTNPNICGDSDVDGCDDCAIGTDGFGALADNTPANDGTDTDGDGICDSGDPDIDGDGCPNGSDPTPLVATVNPDIPSVLSATPNAVCSGSTSTLSWTGELNDATIWYIYTESCGGTQVGISVTNSFTTPVLTGNTTFYIRGEDGAGCVDESTVSCGQITVTFNALDNASFNYSSASYCTNNADPSPTITGLVGGTFGSTEGLSISTSTGAIDLSASAPATYVVTYTTAGICPNSSNVSVTVNALDDASFSYSANAFCVNGEDATPTITGSEGGAFSAVEGLVIDPSTGVIDVSESTPSSYIVTYTTTGICPSASTDTLTINALDDASFSYSANAFCVNGEDATPTITGLEGGAFSSTEGLIIDPSTGVIDASESTPAAYTVTYTTTGTCPNSATVEVTVNSVDLSVSLVSYTLTANAEEATYQWLSCENGGIIIEEATEQSYSALINGPYSVIITQNECTDTSECINVTSVGVNDNESTYNYELFPNPTNGIFTVNLNDLHDNSSITVYNVIGKIVEKQNTRSKSVRIDLTNNDNGIYFVKIQNGKNILVKKIIKQ